MDHFPVVEHKKTPIPDRESKLARIEMMIELAKMRFHWWVAKSTVFPGEAKHCLDTAHRHMELYESCCETRITLIENDLHAYNESCRRPA